MSAALPQVGAGMVIFGASLLAIGYYSAEIAGPVGLVAMVVVGILALRPMVE